MKRIVVVEPAAFPAQPPMTCGGHPRVGHRDECRVPTATHHWRAHANDAGSASRGPAAPVRSTRGVSFWPKEHGAYAQLAFPLLSALCLSRPTPSALALATAAVCGFLAHEPLLVRLGRRGTRRAREDAHAASRRLVALTSVGSLALGAGLWRAPATLLTACFLVALAVLVSACLVLSKREKSLGGELTVAATLSFASIPVAVAARVELPIAITLALAWWAAFALGTLTVHALLRRARAPSTALPSAALGLAVATMLGALAIAGSGGVWAIGLVPQAALTIAVLASGATPRHLRRVGWSMVAAHITTLIALVIGFGR